MSNKKVVSVVVSKSVAFTMPRTTIEGQVDGNTFYTAEKTGDTWEFNLAGMRAKDEGMFLAIHEAMLKVHEKMKEVV